MMVSVMVSTENQLKLARQKVEVEMVVEGVLDGKRGDVDLMAIMEEERTTNCMIWGLTVIEKAPKSMFRWRKEKDK